MVNQPDYLVLKIDHAGRFCKPHFYKIFHTSANGDNKTFHQRKNTSISVDAWMILNFADGDEWNKPRNDSDRHKLPSSVSSRMAVPLQLGGDCATEDWVDAEFHNCKKYSLPNQTFLSEVLLPTYVNPPLRQFQPLMLIKTRAVR